MTTARYCNHDKHPICLKQLKAAVNSGITRLEIAENTDLESRGAMAALVCTGAGLALCWRCWISPDPGGGCKLLQADSAITPAISIL